MERRMPLAVCCTLFCMLALLPVSLIAQPPYVGAKRELRGVWIASVMNYDWPLAPGMTPERQRDSLLVLLDLFQHTGFNAVFFQVRPECDALYPSTLEPWSYWLTGAQGTPPVPSYDPLAFAIAEAHKRGMELHAWFNPYRAYRQDVTYPRSAGHVIEQHPDWAIRCPDGYYFLDPGKAAVRDRIVAVVADVARRYAVDGIHFDDYFYPYPEHSFTRQDSASWAADPRGFPWDSLASWRRDNVNIMIRQVRDTLLAIKPALKFGVSPFGIWKPNVPVGISGLSSFNDIFCDPVAWLQGQYVDYVVPQLYWAFGGGQDYAALHNWWAGQRNGRHVYTGNADYKIALSGWPASEIAGQIRFNQTNGAVQGSVQFRAYNLRTNDGGITGVLTGDVFRYPAVVPVMDWKETTPPDAPSGLQITPDGTGGRYRLTWQPPAPAADGDTAARYIIYRFTSSSPQPVDRDRARNIIGITGLTSFEPPPRIDSFAVQYTYAVAALDRNNNESAPTLPVTPGTSLAAPQQVSPAHATSAYAKNQPLHWSPVPGARLYRVQLDSTGQFADGAMLLNLLTTDTSAVPGGLRASSTYHWRVIAGDQAGESAPSTVRTFTTGWLTPPQLLAPLNKTGISRYPAFRWSPNGAQSYRLRVVDNTTRVTVLDTTVTDTVLTSTTLLAASRIHLWNVLAVNPFGESDWSAEGRFQTGTIATDVEIGGHSPSTFFLAQNYPNPFNPETRIAFGIDNGCEVRLAVYDVLGRQVMLLVDGYLEAGAYALPLRADGLASGAYLYRLQAGGRTLTRQLMLVR